MQAIKVSQTLSQISKFTNHMLVSSAVLFGTATFTQAGTIRHDVDDFYYRDLANYFPSVGSVGTDNMNCSGTLIAPAYLLTAAHCVAFTNQVAFQVGGNTFAGIGGMIHGGWQSGDSREATLAGNDIAVIRLQNPIFDIQPATLYAGSDEYWKVGTYVGFGRTGNGIDGATHYDWNKRAGQNRIGLGGQLSDIGYHDGLLISDLDDPRADDGSLYTETMDLEYQIAPGDSGGGLFIDDKLAGVVSFADDYYADVPFGYNMLAGSIRISTFQDWLNAAINMLGDAEQFALYDSPGTIGGQLWANAPLKPGFVFPETPSPFVLISDEGWENFVNPRESKSVPEPCSILSMFAVGGWGFLVKRNRKKQQSI